MRPATIAKAPLSKRRRDDLRVLVGFGAEGYLRTFARFEPSGSFAPTWNWPAALFGEVWFAWRKMYGLAAGVLVLDLILLWGFQQAGWPLWVRFVAWFATLGPLGNWLYFRHVRSKARYVRGRHAGEEEAQDTLRLEGGTSFRAVVLVVFLAMFVQPMLEGRMSEDFVGVFAQNGWTFPAEMRRLYFW